MAHNGGHHLFVSWSGGLAHPDSPAGGGGMGASRVAGGSVPGLIPSRESPGGRYIEWRGALADSAALDASKVTAEDAPWFGKWAATQLGSILRIPVPGTGGLAIELSPRGFVPKAGSTSTLFIQDMAGKRNLRLDYGFNKNSGSIEWHWNQQGTYDAFEISNHTSAGAAEQALGTDAKCFKYAGRALLVAGLAVDVYSIVVSSKPLRRSIQVVSAWAAASAGCEATGAGGAAVGTLLAPGLGTAAGGILGCAIGGFLGYAAAEATSGYLYDWAEGTIFTKLETEAAPR